MKSIFIWLGHRPCPIRILGFLLILAIAWLPIAIPGYLLIQDPNWRSITTLGILYLEFIVLVRKWGQEAHQYPDVFKRYGLAWSRSALRLLLLGLSIGSSTLALLYGFGSLLGWCRWQRPAANFLTVVLEGLLIAIAVGFAEELLFRGWLLDELARDYPIHTALWSNAALFAVLHSPLYQFPSLWALGAALIWAKRACGGHLSTAIGLHAGFVWSYYLIKVGQLIKIAPEAPVWAMGIEQNPLAGWPAILSLLAIGLGFRTWGNIVNQRVMVQDWQNDRL